MLVPETERTLDSPRSLEALKERKQPSLGELNPLLFPPNLSRRETVEALCLTIERGIEKYGGKRPEFIGATWIEGHMGNPEARFVTCWTVPLLTEKQVSLLEELTVQTFKPQSVLTRKGVGGTNRRNPSYYPKIEAKWRIPKISSY